MNQKTRTGLLLMLAAALLLAVAAPTLAQDPDHRTVHVKKMKIKACAEGEDCTKHAAKVFIAEDGDVQMLGDDGEALVWVSEDGADMHFGGGYLGVQLTALTDELRAHFGVPEGQGVMVAKVMDDSPAWRAGIEVGDIITAVNGDTVGGAGKLTNAVRSLEPGQDATIELWRDGRVQTLSATLAEHEGLPRKLMSRVHVDCGDDAECDDENVFITTDGDAHKVIVKSFGDAGDFDCGAEECEIKVQCEDDSCTCTVNGVEQDCEELHGEHGLHMMRRHHGQQ